MTTGFTWLAHLDSGKLDGEVVEEGSFRNQLASLQKHFGGEPRRSALEAGAQSSLDQPRARAAGSPSDRGQRSGTEVDHRERPQERRSTKQQAELAVIRARDSTLRARTLRIHTVRGLAQGIHHRSFPRAGADRAAGVLASRTPRAAGADRCFDAAGGRIRSAGRAERFAHGREVAGFLGLRPKQRQGGARSSPKAAIGICGSCWCKVHTTFWGPGDRTRRCGAGAWPKRRAEKWTGNERSCCTVCGPPEIFINLFLRMPEGFETGRAQDNLRFSGCVAGLERF
jgi:hypothetical protein